MISSSLATPVAAVATAAVVIYLAIGFLPRPSRAGVLWTIGFTAATVAAYIYVAAEAVDDQYLRAAGAGLIIGAMAIMWSGVRCYRGVRSFAWLSVLYLIAAPAALLLFAVSPAYGIVFRGVFVVSAAFAALVIVELLRLGKDVRDEVSPMMAVSALFVALAATLAVNGIFVAAEAVPLDTSLIFIRTTNLISATVYIVCVLVTVLLLTARAAPAAGGVAFGSFESQARGRLSRARDAGDEWWSLLDVQLDDADDIRIASGTAAFTAATDHFARVVDRVLPADVDIDPVSPTRFRALVPRAQGSVREIIRELLTNVSERDVAPTIPVRMSASVGWAQVQIVGYDFDDLAAAADAGAKQAHAKGGDRWERVSEAS